MMVCLLPSIGGKLDPVYDLISILPFFIWELIDFFTKARSLGNKFAGTHNQPISAHIVCLLF